MCHRKMSFTPKNDYDSVNYDSNPIILSIQDDTVLNPFRSVCYSIYQHIL